MVPRPTEPDSRRRIALVCAGTAGHVYPALALAEAYRRRLDDPELLFIGATGGFGFEHRIVPERGERLECIDARPWVGSGPGAKLAALASLARGALQARALLRREKIELVVSFGGYATPGAMLAARSLGLATAIHEANILPGRANRLVARLVDRIYLASDEARPWFPEDKLVLVGHPLQAAIAALGQETRRPPAPDQRPVRLLVIGGSLGDGFLNRQAPDLAARLAAGGLALTVQHQAGAEPRDPVAQAYQDAGVPAQVADSIGDMAKAYRAADFVISAGGAGSLAEIAVAGLPALLVPSPAVADDHHQANVSHFTRVSGAWYATQADWDPAREAARIAALLNDPAAWQAASAALSAVARPDAADALAADSEALLKTRGAD